VWRGRISQWILSIITCLMVVLLLKEYLLWANYICSNDEVNRIIGKHNRKNSFIIRHYLQTKSALRSQAGFFAKICAQDSGKPKDAWDITSRRVPRSQQLT